MREGIFHCQLLEIVVSSGRRFAISDLRVIATRTSPSCVVSRRLGTLASSHSHFGRHRKRKTILNRFSFTNPTSYARRHNPKNKRFRYTPVGKKKHQSVGLVFLFGCGEGIFHCPPQAHSRLSCLDTLGAPYSLLCAVSRRKKDIQSFLLARPRPPPSVSRFIYHSATNEKRTPFGVLFVGCGEGI